MEEDYTQNELDQLAEELREYSSRLSALFQISYGFEDDPEKVSDYIQGDTSYKDLIDDVDALLEEAEQTLESVTPLTAENREEQLYRKYRRQGSIPEIPVGNWRDFYSEHETVENERGDDLDYRSLQRARNDTILFLLNASKFDEDMNELLPDIEEEGAEIVEETSETQNVEHNITLASRLQPEDLDQENRNTFPLIFGPAD